MQYWLMKSEPSTWSWDDQVKKGAQGEGWDGVRNYQASNNMKAMTPGDRAFFYHSVKEKCVVGIVEIIKPYHPDPTDATGRFGQVTVKAIAPMQKPVSLAAIKANPALAGIALVRQSRLSVLPLGKAHWDEIMRMGETKI